MSSNLYLATTGPNSGKSAVVLGLMTMLSRETQRCGYFRPITRMFGSDKKAKDPGISLICSILDLEECHSGAMKGLSDRKVTELIAAGRYNEMLGDIVGAYKSYESGKDFVLIEGTNYEGATSAFEFNVNADIARALGAPVLLVISGLERSEEEIYENVLISKSLFDEPRCPLLGVIINRVNKEKFPEISQSLENRLRRSGIPFAGAIPEEFILAKPHMEEIVHTLKAEVLYGEHYLDALVHDFRIASMQIPAALEWITAGSLVITAGDRADILLGLIASHMSKKMPKISGILLSGGLRPTENINRLIKGLQRIPFPILAVKTDTWETAINVSRVASAITPQSYRKIETARILFDKHVRQDIIRTGISKRYRMPLTPQLFLYNLLERARNDRKHIVLPEGNEDRILQAVDMLMRRSIVNITLLGEEEDIRNRAEKLSIALEDVRIVNPATSPKMDAYVQTYAELRRQKGVTLESAKEIMQDPSYFGTMMVYTGDADGMVSGSIHTTAHTIRPSFEFIKTQSGIDLVSSVFFMCLADRVLVYGDCAIVPDPTAKELAQIAITSADTAAAFGIEPRVAMLSYSTGQSGSGMDVDKVQEATRLAQQLRPDLPIDGPLQYDAAVDAGVARTKRPDSIVAGRATIFIFPDLNTGNNTYKAVQRSANAIAIGPVLQGLSKPINDLSRGCTVPDIINTIAITAIQAQVASGLLNDVNKVNVDLQAL
jgi:phosphate acetyltransferase